MGKNANKKLTPGLEEELHLRLAETLDQLDDVRDKRKRLSDKLRGHEKVLVGTIALVRRQLKGTDLEQLEIPGSEMPTPANDPVLQEILRVAGLAKEAGLKEPPILVWLVEGENLVGRTPEGTWCIEPRPDGYAILFTLPDGGKSQVRAFGIQEKDAAKKKARELQVEDFADALLKNAGHGELTKKGDKGSETRKK